MIDPLRVSDLISSSDFRKHPDVLKGNRTADLLLNEFKEKLQICMTFLDIQNLNLQQLSRFFEFYIGNQVKDDYFWFIIHKIFQVKFVTLSQLVSGKYL